MVEVFWTVFLFGLFLQVSMYILGLINIEKPQNIPHSVAIQSVAVKPKKKPAHQYVKPKPKIKNQPMIQPPVEKTKLTSNSDRDLVVSGLVHIGMKKREATSLVAKMCKNNYYDDAQKLFEACFPHIK